MFFWHCDNIELNYKPVLNSSNKRFIASLTILHKWFLKSLLSKNVSISILIHSGIQKILNSEGGFFTHCKVTTCCSPCPSFFCTASFFVRHPLASRGFFITFTTLSHTHICRKHMMQCYYRFHKFYTSMPVLNQILKPQCINPHTAPSMLAYP